MKKLIFFLLLPLLVIAVFIVYIYVSAVIENNKTYYFPQIETYLKVYKPPFNKYGYVIFSKDSVFTFSDNIDFVKIYKSETSSVNFIFKPAENNKFFIVDKWNNAQINQVNFVMEKINREDTTFFEQEVVAGIGYTRALKPIYFEIFIEGFLQSVFYSDCNGIEEDLIKAEPIK
ncbi:MAG: hypothetical protein LBB53_02585 [Prevotellaceae bacterium]|jgi:hypothetical protein|nr:hypothetical protein [Prevotellaceae bacterium]